jgi:hypothetical protein
MPIVPNGTESAITKVDVQFFSLKANREFPMKLTFAFLGLLIASSSALASGSPIMECEGTEGSIHINVGVEREVVAEKFQDTLIATSEQNGHSAVRLLAKEIVEFQVPSATEDRAYKGKTVDLALKYVDELETDKTGAYDRIFDGTLKVAGETHQVLCSLHDHD